MGDAAAALWEEAKNATAEEQGLPQTADELGPSTAEEQAADELGPATDPSPEEEAAYELGALDLAELGPEDLAGLPTTPGPAAAGGFSFEDSPLKNRTAPLPLMAATQV